METGSAPRTLERGVSVAIKGGPLVGIDQNVISLGNFLETLFRLRVPRIAVRVILDGKLAVGGFDFLDGRAAGDPEGLVGIPGMAGGHR